MRHRYPFLIVAIVGSLLGAGISRAADLNVTELRKSVVFIRTIAPGLPDREGSGFLVTKDGLIYTNRHVVKSEKNISGSIILVGVPSAKDPDELDYFQAEIVYAPKNEDTLDFAILKIAAGDKYPAFHPLVLKYDRLQLGVAVEVLGYPYVEDSKASLSFNKGIVSSAQRTIEGHKYCQTDAAVNPGNSGGPLLNAAGEVVGIVTLKMTDAQSIGFGLYLSEVQKVAEEAAREEQVAKVHPVVGPLDPSKLPQPITIEPQAANWTVGAGKITPGKGNISVDNEGGNYWLVSKTDLPKNFQITIPCVVGFLKGNQVIWDSQEPILRSLFFRFGSADIKTIINERKGYLIQFSHESIWLYREDKKNGKCPVVKPIGNSDEPMLFTITYDRGEITVTANDEKLFSYKDPSPLSAKNKFCIGGYLSQLAIGKVQIVDLDAYRAFQSGGASQPTVAPVPTTKKAL